MRLHLSIGLCAAAALLLASAVSALLRCPADNVVMPYLSDCLRRNLYDDFAKVNNELNPVLKSRIQSCFADSDGGDKCRYSAADFNVDAYNDETGYLENCPACRSITGALKTIKDKSSDKNPENMVKLRNLVGDALVTSFKSCMGSYGFTRFPDMEEGERNDMDNKRESVNLALKAYSRLDRCAITNGDTAAAAKSQRCLTAYPDSKLPYVCSQVQSCATNDLTKKCCRRIRSARDAFCRCWHGKIEEVREGFAAIAADMKKSNSQSECMNALNGPDGKRFQWFDVIDEASTKYFTSGSKKGVELIGIFEKTCSDLDKAVKSGDSAARDQKAAQGHDMLVFMSELFASMTLMTAERVCHCDINCD